MSQTDIGQLGYRDQNLNGFGELTQMVRLLWREINDESIEKT